MCELETLPAYETWSFCRWVAKMTEEYFKDPEVQRRFEEWQKEERRKKNAKEAQAAV